MAGGGKGTSGKGRGGGISLGRFDSSDECDEMDVCASDIDMSHLYKERVNPKIESRKKYNTTNYDIMRDRDDILRDLYASYEDGGVGAEFLIVQILLDIRSLLTHGKG